MSLDAQLFAVALAAGMLAALTAAAQPDESVQPAVPDEAPIAYPDVDELVVTGRYPGPPLWKVVNGENVLFIFGGLAPVPKGMTWGSKTVETVIGESQEMIGGVDLRAREFNPIKLFRLYRDAKRLSRNPGGATLQEVLPADLYMRYSALKARYRPRDDNMEKLRPGLAAQVLYASALDEVGLRDDDRVMSALERIARRNDVEITEQRLVREPQALLADAAEISTAAEIACFATTLESLETDLQGMQTRAVAWAQGDVALLRRLDYPPREWDCIAAVESAEGLEALLGEIKSWWLAAAERALAANKSTFATLPMYEILAPSGLLEQLRAKGYRVDEPDDR